MVDRGDLVSAAGRSRLHVVACGAIARELAGVFRANRWAAVTLECLPPLLHNDPVRIPERVRERVRAAKVSADTVLVGYADCGTGGLLDVVCDEEGVARLPGAHCYELLAGARLFAELHEREPGTFYLTDYLARSFDRLVIEGLGIAAHPELAAVYFANYRRLVHLAQVDDPALARIARDAASRLGLVHERRLVGTGDLGPVLAAAADRARVAVAS